MTSSERGAADDITENLKENEGTRLKSDGDSGVLVARGTQLQRAGAGG